jgi:hypothetical protein
MALVMSAWIARQAVDRNGGYFSNNEFGDWAVVFGVVVGSALIGGLALFRRPIGRGILLGSVLAVIVVAAAMLLNVVLDSA